MVVLTDSDDDKEKSQKNSSNNGSEINKKLKDAEEKIEKLEKESKRHDDSEYRQTLYKNEGVALILSIVIGLLGINGVGHIYVGKIGKGIFILIGSIILFGVGIGATITVIGAIVGVPMLIAYFIIFIWQIFDARKLCQQYNLYVRENGKSPW